MDNKKAASSDSNSKPTSKSNGFLAQIKQFKTLVIALGAFAGYLYTQGFFSAVFTEKFSLAILWRPVKAIGFETYISTGLTYVFQAVVEFLIAYAILFGFYTLGQFLLNKFQLKTPKKIVDFLLNGLSFCFFIFQPLYFIWFFHVYEQKNSDLLSNLWFWGIISALILLGGFLLFQYQLKNVISLRLKPFVKLFALLFLISVMSTTPPIILYNGYLGHYARIEYAMRDKKGLDYSKVYLTDEKNTFPTGYLTLELTKDFFMGWDDRKKTVTIIPTKVIAKIEKWQAIGEEKRPIQYSPDLTAGQVRRYCGSTASDVNVMIATVNSFYKYRTGFFNEADRVSADPALIDAAKVLPLLTQKCRDDFFEPLFTPAILTQKWQKTKTFRGNLLTDFYGFDLSLPQKTKKGYLEIIVHECWQDFEDQFLLFHLVKNQNKHWLIDAINIVDTPFRFQKAR